MNCLKSLEEVGIKDESLGSISVKTLLNPLAIFFDKKFRFHLQPPCQNVDFKSFSFVNYFFDRVSCCLHILLTAIKTCQATKLFRFFVKNCKFDIYFR